MTPIERAAKALFDEEWDEGRTIHWEEAAPDEREAWFKSARAVLQAIREPSEAMVVDGDHVFRNSIRFDKAALAWRAMIDKALEEG